MKNEIIDTRVNSLFIRVKTVIDTAQQNIVRVVNENMLVTYWSIGMLIVEDEQGGEARAEYGKQIIKGLSQRLTAEYGKGYGLSNLAYFRQFYLAFPILHTCGESDPSLIFHTCGELPFNTALTWSHYRLLMRISNLDEREYYITEAAAETWSVRELERQVNSFYYRRQLGASGRPNRGILQNADKQKTSDFIKDPFVLEFTGLTAQTGHTEKELEQALIDNLQKFILELGKGFAFVARQQRVTTETTHYNFDLTFYNYLLRCFFLIDLKIGKLTHKDVGQMDMYVNMFDELKRNEGDNPTIGLILCSEKDEAVAKYSSILKGSQQLVTAKYMLYLPTEEELARELERERMFYELQKGGDPSIIS